MTVEIRRGLCVVVSLLVFFTAAGDAFAAGVNLPAPPPGKGENCVEPTDLMRRNHMDYLNHQRDSTVHAGVRTPRHSLVGCVDCHVQRDSQGAFIAVDAPGQFCAGCHAFTSVAIDCFECHAAQPDGGEQAFRRPHAEESVQ